MSTASPPPATGPAPSPHGSVGPHAGPPTRRLVRITDRKKIGGVAEGLGWYFGVDPVLFRIAFVVFAISGGFAVPLYIAAMIFLPKATTAELAGMPPARSGAAQKARQLLKVDPSDSRSLLRLGLIGLGVVVLLSQFGGLHGELLLGAALLGVGALLFLDRDEGTVPPPPPPWPPVPASPAPGAPADDAGTPMPDQLVGADTGAGPMPGPWTSVPAESPAPSVADLTDPALQPYGPPPPGAPTDRRVALASPAAPVRRAYDQPYAARNAWHDGGHDIPGGPHPQNGPPRGSAGPRGPRERSVLGRLAVAGMLLAIGIAVLLDRVGAADLTFLSAVGLVVLTAGAALIVGTWFGRARWLIAVGIVGVLLLAAGNSVAQLGPNLRGGFGERRLMPATPAELASDYDLLAGSFTLDLTEVELQQNRQVRVDVTMGELIVIVPEGMDVVARGSITAGDYDVLGATQSGTGLDFTVEQQGTSEGTLTLDLVSTFGEIVVTSAGESDVPATTPPQESEN